MVLKIDDKTTFDPADFRNVVPTSRGYDGAGHRHARIDGMSWPCSRM
jgi:hypothetical protein